MERILVDWHGERDLYTLEYLCRFDHIPTQDYYKLVMRGDVGSLRRLRFLGVEVILMGDESANALCPM